MEMRIDAAGQRLFDDACVALEARTDDVTVMEAALDVICLLLRREEDRLLRDKAVAMLSHCVSELERRGDVPGGERVGTLRGAAREAIRVVIAERPLTASGCRRPRPQAPARRTSDTPTGRGGPA